MALYTASESPAIITREVDLTNGVPNVPTSTGAFVGDFRWGPVNEPVLVNNEATLNGNGVVTAVAVAPNGGYTSEPTVTISAPDSGATPTLTLNYDATNDEIDGITVADSDGSGGTYRYDTAPVFTITGGGSGANGTFVSQEYTNLVRKEPE